MKIPCFDKAADFLKQHSSFLIISHIQPDCDSVGSSAALCHYLIRQGKKAALIVPDVLPSKFNFLVETLPFYDIDSAKEAVAENFEALIILDCSSWSRLGRLEDQFKKEFSKVLVIDHHSTNENFGDASVVEPLAPATAFLIYHFITDSLKGNIVPFEANALMSGLKADTGSFSYSNTSKEVFAVALSLVEAGCEPAFVASNLSDSWSLEAIAFVREALQNIEVFEDGKIVVIYVPYECFSKHKADRITVLSLMKYVRGFEGAVVSVLLYEDEPSKIKASLRSDGTVNVSNVASSFSGGGHICASGLSVNGDIEKVMQSIVTKIREFI